MTTADRTAGTASTEGTRALGRRGFVGALVGAAALAGSAAVQPSPLDGSDAALPGVLRRRTARTATAGTAVTELVVSSDGTRFRMLVPAGAGPHDVVWLHGTHRDGAGVLPAPLTLLANRVVDLGSAAAILPAGTDADQLRAFAWAAQHIGVARSIVSGTASAAASAVQAATDRLLPRLLGVHVTDPGPDLMFGHPAYWSGRRLRIVSTSGSAEAARVAQLIPFATEVSVEAVPDAAADLASTVRRWRA